MRVKNQFSSLLQKYVSSGDHQKSDYFAFIKECLVARDKQTRGGQEYLFWQNEIDKTYTLVADEILTNSNKPFSEVKFGTSGWRGLIGKDLFLESVSQVTFAILSLYEEAASNSLFSTQLGVENEEEAKRRGCVVGFDNRFGNELLARRVVEILSGKGFHVYYAGESTTGTLSAAVLELKAAFSINLTPSHNPLEYAGFKYNAADGGPAAQILTDRITQKAREFIKSGPAEKVTPKYHKVRDISALDLWISLIRKNKKRHGIDYDKIITDLAERDDFHLVVDSVHGASRMDVKRLLGQFEAPNKTFLRIDKDPTFGGIAPEPSTENLKLIREVLGTSTAPLKLGVIMDPDADRVRFTDGVCDIDMNHFGAMAYHFLHTVKGKKGMVAKSVATSNFANKIAADFQEEVFEPKVGFKEFKPVIDQALVCFEESDGITVIGHTSEKDAYIGLFLALDMMLTLNTNLGDYLAKIQDEYGYFYPAKDGVLVSQKGPQLLETLALLDIYVPGQEITLGKTKKKISVVLTIDGHKIIFEDRSWLMIRPSGTEPKVRFYVEGRTEKDKQALFQAAKRMLKEIGLL